jgi:HEAT repeat protein
MKRRLVLWLTVVIVAGLSAVLVRSGFRAYRDKQARDHMAASIAGLKDPNPDVRRGSAKSLGFWRLSGPLPDYGQGALPALIEALNDQETYVRCEVAWALGCFGPEAKDAVPILRGMVAEGVKKRDYRLWILALESLCEMGEDLSEVSPPLVQLLADQNPAVRVETASALVKIGPPAIPALLRVLRDRHEDRELIERAGDALRAIDPETAVKEGIR